MKIGENVYLYSQIECSIKTNKMIRNKKVSVTLSSTAMLKSYLK